MSKKFEVKARPKFTLHFDEEQFERQGTGHNVTMVQMPPGSVSQTEATKVAQRLYGVKATTTRNKVELHSTTQKDLEGALGLIQQFVIELELNLGHRDRTVASSRSGPDDRYVNRGGRNLHFG